MLFALLIACDPAPEGADTYAPMGGGLEWVVYDYGCNDTPTALPSDEPLVMLAYRKVGDFWTLDPTVGFAVGGAPAIDVCRDGESAIRLVLGYEPV